MYLYFVLYFCTQDGTVRLWDLRTAECHAAISPPIAKASVQPPVKCVQFDAGGNWLVVGAGAGLHLWNVHASAMTSTIKTEAPPQVTPASLLPSPLSLLAFKP
jgi:WD40 repeat protein